MTNSKSRLHFILLGLLMLLGLSLPSFASARGVEPSVGHRVGQGSTNVNAFWTPQKMRLAERYDPMRGWLKPGEPDATGAAGQRMTPRHVAPLVRPPAVGRLFFTWLGRPASCSGSVIDTRSQRLVLTAGHCVHYLGIWSERMIFVPAYQNGKRGVQLIIFKQAEANILAMTAGAARTEVAGLHIFYKAFIFLRLGPATAAAWMLACMLIGFTLYQLRILSRVEFRANRETK
jgi:hypothetical protein